MKKLSAFFICTILLFFSSAAANASDIERPYIKVDLWTNSLLVYKNNRIYRVYSIASGTERSPTPIGTFRIIEKSSLWGGGFGSRWMGLNVPWGQYGIHGTNKPMLIGKNISHGCIRMKNQDVEDLFDIIPVGTVVKIEGPITGTGKGAFKNLSVGSKGNLVQLVQERLKFEGFYFGNTDGIYGASTEIAVRKYQKKNRLLVTGGISTQEYRLLGLME